jgi:hypothetical protein
MRTSGNGTLNQKLELGQPRHFKLPRRRRRHVVIKICNNKYKIKKACDDAIVEPPFLATLFSVAV